MIPNIADRICQEFAADGFEVKRDNLTTGGVDISVTKGGMFMAVVGMKSALKITLIPQGESIAFEAGVGIFGQQALPTVISMLFFWPVLLTQIWGLIRQSNLDDKALAIAQEVVNESPASFPSQKSRFDAMKFCTNCGAQLSLNARFCSNCGTPMR